MPLGGKPIPQCGFSAPVGGMGMPPCVPGAGAGCFWAVRGAENYLPAGPQGVCKSLQYFAYSRYFKALSGQKAGALKSPLAGRTHVFLGVSALNFQGCA